MKNNYTDKEKMILQQYENGPYHILVTELTEEEHLNLIEKLINDNNIGCIIFLTCIYIDYNQKYLIDYFINRKNVDDLVSFLDHCNDFWKELDQKYIVDKIILLNDKKYVKDILDTNSLYFLTNQNERKKLETFLNN